MSESERCGSAVKRHSTDFVALVTGLLFLGVGIVYMVAEYSDLDIDARWIGPAALIGIGVVGLAAVVTRERSSTSSKGEPADPSSAETDSLAAASFMEADSLAD